MVEADANEARALAAAIPLSTWLTPSSLTKACFKQRARGAPSNKVGYAQVHRALSRSLLSQLSVTWLRDGTVPRGPAAASAFLVAADEDERRPLAGFSDRIAGGSAEFGKAAAAIADALSVVGDARARVALPLQDSNLAIGLLAPWLSLRSVGASSGEIGAVLQTYLAAVAPASVDALIWEAIAGHACAADPSALPVRRTCCLKYTTASRLFCGTCPFR